MMQGLIRKITELSKRLRETLLDPDQETDPSGELSVPATSWTYNLKKKVQFILVGVSGLLLHIEPFWVIAAGALFMFSLINIVKCPVWYGVILAALPSLARWIKYGYLSRRTPFDIPLALLLVAGLIGIYVSPDRSVSWSAYQSLMIWVMAYYSFANYDYPENLVRIGLPLGILGVLVVGGYIFLQTPTSLPFFSQLQDWLHLQPLSPEGWAKPPLGASSCGATIAVEVMTIIAASMALFPGKKIVRAMYAVFTILLLGLLVISPCRATWPIMIVGILFLLGWRSRWLLLSLPAWIAVALWSVTYRIGYSWTQVWENITYLMQGRVPRWGGIIDKIAEHPLTGCGLGGYTLPYSHNSYIQFYCDFGLLGALALVGLAAMFLRIGWQMRNIPADRPWLGISAGIWVAILLAALYAIVESAPACILAIVEGNTCYAISPLFFLLGGALIATYRALKKGLPQ